MFLFALGGSVALGAGLFAIASFSDGALLAARTVAQGIGWLFILATIAGAAVLRRSEFAGITAATITLGSGLLLLYVTHFDWSELRTMPMAYAAMETRPADLKVIENPSPTLAAALGMKAIVIPDMPKAEPRMPLLGPIPVAALPSGAMVKEFSNLEAAQRRRCSEKVGLAWLLCQESARLEYCESRENDPATCPSPIPQAYPG
jgi:hypothetical protein